MEGKAAPLQTPTSKLLLSLLLSSLPATTGPHRPTRPLLLHRYSYENAPVQKELAATEVGSVATFLVSPLASAITGQTIYVDNGLSIMGLAGDSKTLDRTVA